MDTKTEEKKTVQETVFNFEDSAGDGEITEREKRFLSEYAQKKRKNALALIIIIVLLLAAFIVSFGVGRYAMPPGEVIESFIRGIQNGVGEISDWGAAEDTVVWLVRLPRILAAVLVGAALSASGATYQGLFRNPMVSPDILGASAGASVGACLMMLLNQNTAMIQVGAFIMGIAAVALSYFLSKAIGRGGLMIPHLVRFLVGPNNKTLVPMSLLTGGLFMLIIDNLCRSLLAYEIPLGVLTSLLGAPFFIFILYKRKGNG